MLGGHSLGGGVVTAYATWDFGGHPGADELAGLVYIDGGSFGAARARPRLGGAGGAERAERVAVAERSAGSRRRTPGSSASTGSLAALVAPTQPSLGQSSGLLAPFRPDPVGAGRPTSAQFGYALNVGTSPPTLIAAQAHLGTGIRRPARRAAGTAPAR